MVKDRVLFFVNLKIKISLKKKTIQKLRLSDGSEIKDQIKILSEV